MDQFSHVHLNSKQILFSKTIGNDFICFGIAGYNLFVTALNRATPVVIAVYRYCLVFHYSSFYTTGAKSRIQKTLLVYAFGNFTGLVYFT